MVRQSGIYQSHLGGTMEVTIRIEIDGGEFEPVVSTPFVESAVNQLIDKRMSKAQ